MGEVDAALKKIKRHKTPGMSGPVEEMILFWMAGEQNGQAGFRDGLAVKGLA